MLDTTKNILTKASQILELFLNGAELSFKSVDSVNSGNLINHFNINWAQFKDPVSHIVACWHCGSIVVSYTRGGRFIPFNDKYFCH